MDWIVIGLCVGAAMVYMGRRMWRMLRGTGEVSCGGCGKCAAACASRQSESEACGLRDMRR